MSSIVFAAKNVHRPIAYTGVAAGF